MKSISLEQQFSVFIYIYLPCQRTGSILPLKKRILSLEKEQILFFFTRRAKKGAKF